MVKTIRLGLFICVGLFFFAALRAQNAPASSSTPAPGAATETTGTPAAAGAATTPADSSAMGDKGAAGTLVVPSGTRLPLVLHNSITTRNAQPGDPIYLETTFPIVQDERVLVPAGSYVQGEITEAKRPGKVKGTGELRVRLTTMILPNGYTVKFGAVPTNAGTGGNESTDKEGTIHGDTDKASDVSGRHDEGVLAPELGSARLPVAVLRVRELARGSALPWASRRY